MKGNGQTGRDALTAAEIRTIIIGVMMAMFLAALDQTIVATALPTIGRDLGGTSDLAWVVTSYLIAATAAAPLQGKLSDIHGRRAVMLGAIAVFVIGSIACALAPSTFVLIIARAVQGLGGGGLIALAQTVLADVSAPRERGRYQAYFASVFASANLAGPVLGGVLADHVHWSVIFWINVPLGLVALMMSNAALKKLPRHERPHRLDIAGAVLLVIASVALMLALSWGGVHYPWLSKPIGLLLAGSLVVWVLFGVHLQRTAEPLIPLTVLSNGIVRAGTAASGFAMGGLIGLTIFLPVYFEAVQGLSASQSGLALIPLTIGTVCGATFSGRAMSHVVRYKRLPLIGVAVAAAGCAVLAAVPQGIPLGVLLALLGLLSIGLGTVLPVTTVAVQNAVLPHELGTTTASIGFFRQLGGAFMVAVFGAIVLGGGALESAGAAAGAAGTAGRFAWMFAAASLCFLVALLCLALMREAPLRSGPSA